MPYMYQAAFLCDDCGEAVCKSLTKAGQSPETPNDESSFDSDDFPKYCGDDIGECDSPHHCDSNEDCINAIDLDTGSLVGDLIPCTLTDDGIAYVKELYREARAGYPTEASRHSQRVTEFWVNEFDIDIRNKNCLEGMMCPKCGNYKSFEIDAKATFIMTDDGPDNYSNLEWDSLNNCSCTECNYSGYVSDFEDSKED